MARKAACFINDPSHSRAALKLYQLTEKNLFGDISLPLHEYEQDLTVEHPDPAGKPGPEQPPAARGGFSR